MFYIWLYSKEKVKKELNSFDSNIKFSYKFINKNISFLHLWAVRVENKLFTSLFVKLTNRHQYLHYSSGHPGHAVGIYYAGHTIQDQVHLAYWLQNEKV